MANQKIGIKIQNVGINKAQATKLLQQQLNEISRGLRISIGSQTTQTQLISSFSRISDTVRTVNANLGQMNTALQRVQRNTQNVHDVSQRMHRTYLSNISMIVKKVLDWAIGVNIVYTSFRKLREGIQELIEIDKTMTSISRVTNLTVEEMEKLKIVAAETGQELSKTANEYLTSFAAFSKMGFGEQAGQLAEIALMFSSVGDMDIEKSQKTLISVMRGMNLEIKDSAKIMDSLNNVANKNATSVDELSSGLQKFASTAKTANMDIDETIALLGGLQASSQETGSVVGNALKTVVMRLSGVTDNVEVFQEDISKTEISLRSIGIEVRDSATEMRPAIDVLRDVASEWENLTDVEKAYVGEALGGKLRGGLVKTLLQNFDQVEKQLSESISSFGSATREYDIYTNSIEAKTKKLQATWTEFWLKSIETDTIKTVVDGIQQLVDIIAGSGGLITILGALGIAFASFKFAKWAMTLGNVTTGVVTLGDILTGTTLKAQGAATAMKGFVASLTLTKVALGLLPIALTAAFIIYQKFANAEEEANQKREEAIRTLTKQSDEISNAKKEYEKISKSVIDETTKKEQLNNIQETLIKSYGVEAEAIDLVNGKYEEQVEVLNEISVEKAREALAELGTSLEDARKFLESEIDTAKIFGEGFELPKFGIDKISKEMISDLDTINEYIGDNIAKQKQFIDVSGNVKDVSKDIGILITRLQEQHKITIDVATKRDLGKYINELSESYKKLNNNIDVNQRIIESTKPYEQALAGKIENTKANEELVETTDEYNNSLQNLSETQNEVVENTENQIISLDDYKAELDFLVKLEDELTNSRKLSGDTIVDIIQKYPQFIQYIGDEKAMLKAVQQEQINKGKIAKDVLQQEMENSQEYWSFLQQGNSQLFKSLVENYNVDLSNFKNFGSAKVAIDNKVRKIIGEGWSALYGALTPTQELNLAIGTTKSMAVTSVEQGKSKTAQLQQLESLKSQYSAISQLGEQIKTTVGKIDFDMSSLESSTGKNSKGKSEKDSSFDAIGIERDRYIELNNELERLNQLIERNNQLQKNADFETKNKLLNEEIELLSKKQQTLHKIANEKRKEASELQVSLKNQGVRFDETGNITNLKEITKVKNEQLKAIGNKDKYEEVKKNTEKFFDDIDTIIKIRTEELSELGTQWINLGIEKEDLYKLILTNQFDIFDESIKIIDSDIQNLDNSLSKIDDKNYSQKFELMKNKTHILSSITDKLNSELERLSLIVPKTSSEAKTITERIEELTKSLEDNKYELEDNEKAFKSLYDAIIETQKTKAENVINSYFGTLIKGLEEEIGLLEEKKKKVNDDTNLEIKLIDEQIKALQNKKQVDRENIDNLKEQEQYLDKINELTKELSKKEEELSNVLKEKNKRILKDGKWIFEHDVIQARKLQEDIDELNKDKAKTRLEKIEETTEKEKDLEYETSLEILENNKQKLEENLQLAENSYNDRIENIEIFIDEQKNIFENYGIEQYTTQEQLYKELELLDSNSYNNRLISLQNFVTSYNREYSKLSVNEIRSVIGTPIVENQTPKTSREIGTFREYTESLGYKIGWDDSTKTVTLNNKPIDTGDMQIKEGHYVGTEEQYKSIIGQIAKFKNEGYTGTWNNNHSKLALVDPREWILSSNTVSDMMTGKIQSGNNNIAEKLINNNPTNNSYSNDINITNLTVVSNNAENLTDQLRRKAYKSM